MKFRVAVPVLVLLLSLATFAQEQKKPKPDKDLDGFEDPLAKEKEVLGRPATYTPPNAQPPKPVPTDLSTVVHKQFGLNFEVFPGESFHTGDFDSDGVEDAVIIVRAEKPFIGEVKYGFRPLAPQDEYFGYGDPKIALSSEFEPWKMRRLLLVIHGLGTDGWRAEKPKAKFLIVNIPFDKLQVADAKVKKKTLSVIHAEETSVMSSVLYWDGKKYKWRPNQELN